MKFNYLIISALFPLLVACIPPNIPASQIDSISEYKDGVAIVKTTDGDYCFVDSELVPIGEGKRFNEISEFIDGYALARSSFTKYYGDATSTTRQVHIVSRNGDIVETFDQNATPVIIPGGHAWVTNNNGIALKDLPTGRILFEENAWVHTETPSGTAVLARRRTDRHPEGYDYAYLVEFMIVDRNGNIVVPWGRIGYIGEFSNGLAVASNSTQGGIRDFSDGVERYSRSRIYSPKYGYIDESGEWVIPEKFYGAEKFNEEGYAKVLTKHYVLYSEIEYHYINDQGKVLSGKDLDAALRSFRK